MKFQPLFLIGFYFALVSQGLCQDARVETLKEIERLEKTLKEQPKDSFDWHLHNSLRHLYASVVPKKAMEHVEAIFQHQPLDDYTKMVIGGKDADKAKAAEKLLKITVDYPDLKCTKACCYIWLSELAGDKVKAREWYEKAAALDGLTTLCREAVEDHYLFTIADRLTVARINSSSQRHGRPSWSLE